MIYIGRVHSFLIACTIATETNHFMLQICSHPARADGVQVGTCMTGKGFTYCNVELQVPDQNNVVLPGACELRTLQAADQTTVANGSRPFNVECKRTQEREACQLDLNVRVKDTNIATCVWLEVIGGVQLWSLQLLPLSGCAESHP